MCESFAHNGPHGGPKETVIGRFDARTYYDSSDNSPNGVFGDQTDAMAEIGAIPFDAASDQPVELLQWLDEQPFDDLMPEPHVNPQSGSRRSERSQNR